MTFPSTLLPQTNDPKDIQKGILDLLDKINKVAPSTGASGSTYKSVSASYTFTSSDGITDLFVTTGATSVTITLDKSSNGPRTVRIWKSDSGVGEVVVIGNTTGGTTETINGYANVIAGLRYQHCDIYQDGQGNNFLVGQYLQPVSGERSLGTDHITSDANRTVSMVVNTSTNTAGVWSAAVTMTGVPVGARAAYCQLYMATVGSRVAVEAATGYTLSDITAGGNQWLKYHGTSATGNSIIKIHLDANGQFKWCTGVTSTALIISSAIDYEM